MIRSFKIIVTIALILLSFSVNAQEERRLIREGIRLYNEGDFAEAEKRFIKARELAPDLFELESNIGASKYRQGMFESALRHFNNVLDLSETNEQKADAFYNMGNSLLQAGEYDKSVEAYRNALRLNPDHDRSRYNMAVATKIQEQQEQQQQDQDDDQDQDQDQDDEQEQDQDQDEGDDEQEQEQQQDQTEMTPEEMERFLEALEIRDRELQEELQKERHEAERREVERNW